MSYDNLTVLLYSETFKADESVLHSIADLMIADELSLVFLSF